MKVILVPAAAGLITLAVTADLWAQGAPSGAGPGAEASPETPRQQARKLAELGAKAFEAGDFSAALEHLTQAETLVPVPTIGIEVARTLVELDRFREAVAAYARVEAMTLPDEMPERFKQVQRQRQNDAKAEREALAAEMPRVELAAVGAPPDELRVDGELITLDGPSATIEVDPGRHEVEAKRGPELFRQEVRVGRGSKVVVELRFGEREKPPPDPGTGSPADDGLWSILVPVGWTAVGVGAASLVVGGITFSRARSLKSDLDAQCPDGTCRSSQAGFDVEDDIATYDAFRSASVATFAIGAGLAVIGTGLLVAPLIFDDTPETPDASVGIGPGSVELKLRF